MEDFPNIAKALVELGGRRHGMKLEVVLSEDGKYFTAVIVNGPVREAIGYPRDNLYEALTSLDLVIGFCGLEDHQERR